MFYNPYLVIPFTAWIVAQLIKFSLSAWRGKVDFRYLYASGGMPSGHSAVVSALAVTALLLDGANSHLFGLTAVLAAIVMYDSFGVRRASGEQAAALNMLIDSLDRDKIRLRDPKLKLREVLGHKPLEVTFGALLGIGFALVFNLSRISAQLAWLSALPFRRELFVYAGLFGLIVVAGVAVRVWLGLRFPKSAAIRPLQKQLFLMSQVIGWIGLVAAFSEYESLPTLSWRAWPLIIGVAGLVWAALIWKRFRMSVPAALEAEQEAARRRKWLTFGKKGSKKGRN